MTTAAQRHQYLSVAQVAAELGCSQATIRRRIRTGELIATRLGQSRNSAVRVSRGALQAWLERGELRASHFGRQLRVDPADLRAY